MKQESDQVGEKTPQRTFGGMVKAQERFSLQKQKHVRWRATVLGIKGLPCGSVMLGTALRNRDIARTACGLLSKKSVIKTTKAPKFANDLFEDVWHRRTTVAWFQVSSSLSESNYRINVDTCL